MWASKVLPDSNLTASGQGCSSMIWFEAFNSSCICNLEARCLTVLTLQGATFVGSPEVSFGAECNNGSPSQAKLPSNSSCICPVFYLSPVPSSMLWLFWLLPHGCFALPWFPDQRSLFQSIHTMLLSICTPPSFPSALLWSFLNLVQSAFGTSTVKPHLCMDMKVYTSELLPSSMSSSLPELSFPPHIQGYSGVANYNTIPVCQ